MYPEIRTGYRAIIVLITQRNTINYKNQSEFSCKEKFNLFKKNGKKVVKYLRKLYKNVLEKVFLQHV